MTIDRERVHAVNATRDFLRDLVDPARYNSKTSVREIRERALCLLKHYPGHYEAKRLLRDGT